MSDTASLPPAVSAAVKWALEHNAEEPVLLDVRGHCSYTDFLLILGGRSTRQVRAVADAVRVGMKKDGHTNLGVEGLDEGRWALLDFDEVVVHVFIADLREFYDLESLWVEAPRVNLADYEPVGRAEGAAKG